MATTKTRAKRAGTEARCSCGAVRPSRLGGDGEPVCPIGWKRHPSGELLCRPCWDKRYVMRAVTIPVAGPVGMTWDPLRTALQQAWRDCTHLANACVSALYAAEPPHGPKLAKLPPVYLYGLLYRDRKSEWPSLSSGTAVSIMHAVEGCYREARFDCVQRRERALPTYTYPTPLPVRASDWTITETAGVYTVSVPLGRERFGLRLRGGHNFARQLAVCRQIVKGEAIGAEVSLYQVEGSSGDHRPRVEERDAGGGTRSMKKLLCKIVAWLPRKEHGALSGKLLVRTDPDSLLVYNVDGSGERSVLRINGDHVRRWIAEHRRRLDRTSDDLKAERRSGVGEVRPPVLDQRRRWSSKQNRRLDSFTHEVSAQVASFAARQRVATVVYDDRDKRFVDKFPWAELALKLKYKCDDRGIAFETIDATATVGAS